MEPFTFGHWRTMTREVSQARYVEVRLNAFQLLTNLLTCGVESPHHYRLSIESAIVTSSRAIFTAVRALLLEKSPNP